jgi:DtxR family Mn-dependent transcriptional regulator
MPSLTVENYLKAIWQIAAATDSSSVSTGKLAQSLKVSPGTVTSMQKTLAEAGLAEYRPYEGVSLTEAGRTLALRMLRRHRLIELFLVQTLGLTWDQVHEEAENMEHAVSDFLIDRIDDFLGNPTCDPHGDPIPNADGDLRSSGEESRSLSEVASGSRVRLVRVLNQDADFLRYLTDSDLSIGATACVEQVAAAAGMVSLRRGDRSIAMGREAAEQLLVVVLPSEGRH